MEHINLTLSLQNDKYIKYITMIDDEILPVESCVNYDYSQFIFKITPGKHKLKIISLRNNRINPTGKIKFKMFTGSQRNYMNHFFAFNYDIYKYTFDMEIIIHRDAELMININKDVYYNFLNIKSCYYNPKIKNKKNIKVNKTDFCIFDSKKDKTRYYLINAFIFTLYNLLIAVLMIHNAIEYLSIGNNSWYPPFSGYEAFLFGTFPIIVYIPITYFIYIKKLCNCINNNLDSPN